MSNSQTYKEIGVRAYGKKMGPVIQFVMVAYTFGSCVSFIVLIGDSVPRVLTNYPSLPDIFLNRIPIILFMSVGVLLPLSFLKDLNPLRFTSFIGVACIIYACGFVISQWLAVGVIAPTADIVMVDADLFRAIPIMTIAFAAHYNGPKFFEELGSDLPKFKKVVIAEGIIAFFFYALTGLGGYWLYGSATMGNVLTNYSPTDTQAVWARLTTAFSVTFTYPFAFHSLKKNVDEAFPPAAPEGGSAGYSELNPAPAHYHPPESTLRRVILTCTLWASTVGVAILIPEIEVVLAYKGALFGSFVIFIFPGVFYLRLLKMEQARTALKSKTEGDDGEFEAFIPTLLEESARLPPLAWSVKGPPLFLIVFGTITGLVGTTVTAIKQFNGGTGH